MVQSLPLGVRLQQLDLSGLTHDEVFDEGDGGEVLGLLFAKCTSLQTMDLSMAIMSAAVLLAMVQALPADSDMRELHLGVTDELLSAEETVGALVLLVTKCRCLRSLHLGYVCGEKDLGSLCEQLQELHPDLEVHKF